MKAKKGKKKATELAENGKHTLKPLAEMNLLDDFLFGSMVTCPEIGERFVRILLKTIFGREFRHLSVTAQKVFYGADTDRHGARLDVYLEPEEDTEDAEGLATVYDIEPDRNNKTADIEALPRRVRFYHGKIAARNLNSGKDFDELKNVIIIMIMPYDPFGLDHMVYTVKNRCLEVPEMEYEDGASTMFLYTKGTVGVPDEAVKQLLHYMEVTEYENAVNEDLREIHRMVEMVKRDPEVGGMRIQIMEDVIRLSKENARLSEEKTRAEKEKTRAEKEKTKAEKAKTRAVQENAKLSEEILRLRKELEQKKAVSL